MVEIVSDTFLQPLHKELCISEKSSIGMSEYMDGTPFYMSYT